MLTDRFITKQTMDRFYEYLIEEERSSGTIEKYIRDVRLLQSWLGSEPVTKENAARWKQELLQSGRAPSTVNSMLAAANTYFRFMGWDDLKLKSIRLQRRFFRENERELTKAEYQLLMETAKKRGDERLALLMETICATGIRVSEVPYITTDAIKKGRARISMKGKEEIPLEWGGKLVFINSVVGGAIDARFMPAILKGVMSRMEQGPLTGSYARDVRVIVYDGKMHPVDSNELSFMLAGRQAFSEAFKAAGPKILEPIYDVEVFVPADKMGDVMSDLQGRRGMIVGMSSENGYEKLQAKVPLKEMGNYSTSLSSLTGGRASFIMKFASYELVPGDIQNKLVEAFEKEQAE